jgi:hypothetical protein
MILRDFCCQTLGSRNIRCELHKVVMGGLGDMILPMDGWTDEHNSNILSSNVLGEHENYISSSYFGDNCCDKIPTLTLGTVNDTGSTVVCVSL